MVRGFGSGRIAAEGFEGWDGSIDFVDHEGHWEIDLSS